MESGIAVSRQHGAESRVRFCREGVERRGSGCLERKRKDKAFRERLRAVVERDREILERLAR